MPEPQTEIDKKGLWFYFKKGFWIPLTVILALPFVLIFIPLYRAARTEVHWKAVFATITVFEIVMFLSEHFSLSRGHWVWNEARILGPKIWGVPIEEPLLYYWFPVIFVITLLHAIRKAIKNRMSPTDPA